MPQRIFIFILILFFATLWMAESGIKFHHAVHILLSVWYLFPFIERLSTHQCHTDNSGSWSRWLCEGCQPMRTIWLEATSCDGISIADKTTSECRDVIWRKLPPWSSLFHGVIGFKRCSWSRWDSSISPLVELCFLFFFFFYNHKWSHSIILQGFFFLTTFAWF